MKKLVLLAIVATFATSAFAQKGLVELQGCFDGTCDTLDFDMNNDTADFNDDADADEESQNLALNYNHLFTDNFGAGIYYRQSSATVDGDIVADNGENLQTIGLNFFWNLDSGWMGKYVALRYWMTTTEESDLESDGTTDNTTDDSTDSNTIVLEYGHRVALGKALGVSFAWNPSVQYSMTTTSQGESGTDDREATNLTIQPVNFAVAF